MERDGQDKPAGLPIKSQHSSLQRRAHHKCRAVGQIDVRAHAGLGERIIAENQERIRVQVNLAMKNEDLAVVIRHVRSGGSGREGQQKLGHHVRGRIVGGGRLDGVAPVVGRRAAPDVEVGPRNLRGGQYGHSVEKDERGFDFHIWDVDDFDGIGAASCASARKDTTRRLSSSDATNSSRLIPATLAGRTNRLRAALELMN